MHRPALRAARPHDDAAMAALGLAGGALAGLAALAALVVGNVALTPGAPQALRALDHEVVRDAALEAVNSIGAWLVRWLQVADPSALVRPYADATLGGLVTVVLFGALLGALLAAAGERFPEDAPLVWTVLASIGLWLATRFVVAPALDPLLLRTLDGRLVFVAHVVFGLVLGGWLSASRAAVALPRPALAGDRA